MYPIRTSVFYTYFILGILAINYWNLNPNDRPSHIKLCSHEKWLPLRLILVVLFERAIDVNPLTSLYAIVGSSSPLYRSEWKRGHGGARISHHSSLLSRIVTERLYEWRFSEFEMALRRDTRDGSPTADGSIAVIWPTAVEPSVRRSHETVRIVVFEYTRIVLSGLCTDVMAGTSVQLLHRFEAGSKQVRKFLRSSTPRHHQFF